MQSDLYFQLTVRNFQPTITYFPYDKFEKNFGPKSLNFLYSSFNVILIMRIRRYFIRRIFWHEIIKYPLPQQTGKMPELVHIYFFFSIWKVVYRKVYYSFFMEIKNIFHVLDDTCALYFYKFLCDKIVTFGQYKVI